MKRVGVICGGSGSSKFARAFANYAGQNLEYDLGYVVNVADDYWYHSLYVCPDVDIITHALAGNLDVSKGWGVASDSFSGKQFLSKISDSPEWFSLGDSDSALCLRRAELMKKGWRLSTVTDYFRGCFEIKSPIIPATDDPVTTYFRTASGLMHLQQFWVKNKALPDTNEIEYVGLESATPNPDALSYISEFAIICPANPVTSILPTIRLKKVEKQLIKSRVVGISPFVGNNPFSGPAAKLMSLINVEANSFGVASLYSRVLKLFFVHVSEEPQIISRIRDLGIECIKTNIMMDESSSQAIAGEIMNSL